MRRLLWWFAFWIVILHQFAERFLDWHWLWADAYLDPLLCMPLILGLVEWEWAIRFDKPKLHLLEVVAITVSGILLFEWGFPNWSASFTADPWDAAAYLAGSTLFYAVQKLVGTSPFSKSPVPLYQA